MKGKTAVLIQADEDYPVYNYFVPTDRSRVNAFLSKEEIAFIDKAEHLYHAAQEMLETAYNGATREEILAANIEATKERNEKMLKKGERLKL